MKLTTKLRASNNSSLFSDSMVRMTQKVARVGSWVWHVKENRLEWSDEMYEIFGVKKGEFTGDLAKMIFRVIHPDGSEAVEIVNGSSINDISPVPFERRIILPDGSSKVVWAEAGEFILDKDGKPESVMGIVQDITAWRESEENAAAIAREWQTTFDASTDSIMVLDKDCRVKHANKASRNIFGRPSDEIVGKFCWEIVHGTSISKPDCIIIKAQGSSKTEAVEVQLGEDWFVITVDPILDAAGNWSGAVHRASNITSEKRSEEFLRIQYDMAFAFGSKAGLHEVIDACLQSAIKLSGMDCGGIYIVDEGTGNLRLASHVNLSADFISSMGDLEPATSSFKIVEKGNPVFAQHSKITSNHSSLKEGLLAIAVIPILCQGKVIACLNLASHSKHEVDPFVRPYIESFASQAGGFIARAMSEETLRKGQAERDRLVMAIEHAAEMIVMTDPKGGIQYVNPAFEKVTGYSRGEVLGRNPNILKSGKQSVEFYAHLWGTINSGKTWHGRFIDRKKNGRTYVEEATISPVYDNSGAIVNFVAVKRDITHELDLESKLLQVQKIESIGRLAGGIAHDFNNMLGVILGYTEMVMSKHARSELVHDELMEIQKAALRSADLTKQLLAFARKQPIVPKILNLNDLLADMLPMLRKFVGEAVEMEWRPGSGLWPVKMDPSQISQILTNLCVNARDAISGNGKVVIETRNIVLTEAECVGLTECVPGYFTLLTVADNGCGMDEKVQEHLFEPFFTTKGLGRGTGLGLSTVYGIVKQNHGLIRVFSEPGKGAEFKIFIPRHVGDHVMAQAVTASNPAKRAGKTVLLVEDERVLLEMTKTMLESMGHEVIPADSPEHALELARDRGKDIHLILTDVVMPNMDGMELFDRIVGTMPEVKVVFMSGYATDAMNLRGASGEKALIIQKPFSIDDLASIVDKALR